MALTLPIERREKLSSSRSSCPPRSSKSSSSSHPPVAETCIRAVNGVDAFRKRGCRPFLPRTSPKRSTGGAEMFDQFARGPGHHAPFGSEQVGTERRDLLLEQRIPRGGHQTIDRPDAADLLESTQPGEQGEVGSRGAARSGR